MNNSLPLSISVKGTLRLARTEWLLLLVAIFWGCSYGVTKSALVFTSVFMFMAIRFLLTFALLSYPTLRDFRANRNADWKVAIPTGGILLAIFCCEVIGVSKTSATNAAFLISLSAMLSVFLDVFVNRKPLDRRWFWLSALSVAGVCLLTQNGDLKLALNTGDGFILAAAFLRAAMVTTTKKFAQGKRITSLSLTALQSLVVGVGSIFLLVIQPSNAASTVPREWEFWGLILYLVLFCTLFAFFIQNYAVRKISSTKVSLLMGSEPLFGALFALVWLGETLSSLQYLGSIIILITIYFASRHND